MLSSTADQPRAVIPRWRSLAIVPPEEIASVKRLRSEEQLDSSQMADQVALWKKEHSLEANVDLMDTGLVTGDTVLVRRGALGILKSKEPVASRVLEAADRALTAPNGPNVDAIRLAEFEADEDNVKKTLALLRRRMNEYSRDGTIPLEMARLYTTLGQNGPAELMLQRALSLMPDDRAVLRASSLFYHLVQDHREALRALWRSDSLRYDPWLQSAEIAVAGVAETGSRCAKIARDGLRGVKRLNISRSELALGVATMELRSGRQQRHVFQLVGAALSDPTENALAQAFWISDQTSRALGKRYPQLTLPPHAYEARALALFDERDYEGSFDAAMMWLRDQPFHPEPAVFILNIASIQLENAQAVVPLALRASALHPSDWAVQNASMIALCSAGEIEEAKRCARNLEVLAKTSAIKAFAEAGWGMICYREGDVLTARLHYVNALEIAREAKRPELVVNAFMFHAFGEARSCLADVAELRRSIELVDEFRARIPPDARMDIERMWEAIKAKIEIRIATGEALEGAREQAKLIDDSRVKDLLEQSAP